MIGYVQRVNDGELNAPKIGDEAEWSKDFVVKVSSDC